MLALIGQIPSRAIGKGHGMLHEIPDQLGILRTLTKWAERIERAAGRARGWSRRRSASCSPAGRGRSASSCRPTCSAAKAEVELLAPLRA